MKKYYLILLLLTPLFTIAQSNYKKGFIVPLKGDTVHGYIDYKEWTRSPQNINFKTDLNADKKLLGVNDMNSFGIDGAEYYKHYEVRISMDGNQLANAPSAIDSTSKTDNVFLKILQTGKNLTLYSYTDALKTRYYIKDNTMEVPQELSYKVYIGADNNLITRNFYYNQLNEVAVKSNVSTPELTKQIEQSTYGEEDMIGIVTKINGNSGKPPVSVSVSHAKGRFFIGAAYSANTLKYASDGDFTHPTGTKSNVPRLTLGYDAILNPNVGRLIFRGELGFTANSYTVINVDNSAHDGSQRTLKQAIKQITFSVTPQVIYNLYNTDAVKIFVDGGASFNISSYPTNDYSDSDALNPKPRKGVIKMKSAWITFPLKAGVVISKRLEIYGTYAPPVSLTFDYGSINLDSYQVGINYLFGK